MADIFDELLGPNGAPPQELIAALRRQRGLGQVGALSGDQNIRQLGSAEYDDAMKQATGVRDRRDRSQAREDQLAFQKWQQEQANASRADDRKYRYDALRQAAALARAQSQNALDVARIREGGDAQAAGAAAQKNRNQQLNKLEAALRTSGLGNVWSAIQGAKGVVDEYTERDPQGNVTGYKGVPGVGGLANARTLGMGTLATTLGNLGGAGKAKENQAKIAALQNLVLQARSGAAVTDPELQRMLTETGLTMFSSDEDFLRAFPELVKKSEQAVRNTMAGYDPDIVEEFLKRGGLPGYSSGKMGGRDNEIERILGGD